MSDHDDQELPARRADHLAIICLLTGGLMLVLLLAVVVGVGDLPFGPFQRLADVLY